MSDEKRYRQWGGNPKGNKEDPDSCVAEVADGGRSVLFHQCRRKRGHGTDGKYCKQHAKTEMSEADGESWCEKRKREGGEGFEYRLMHVTLNAADRIDQTLWERNMSRKDLADALGCRESDLGEMLNDPKDLSVSDLLGIAEVLGVELGYLFVEGPTGWTINTLVEARENATVKVGDLVHHGPTPPIKLLPGSTGEAEIKPLTGENATSGILSPEQKEMMSGLSPVAAIANWERKQDG